jgi:hypothetical protein
MVLQLKLMAMALIIVMAHHLNVMVMEPTIAGN